MWVSLRRLGKKALSGERQEDREERKSGDKESGLPRGPGR